MSHKNIAHIKIYQFKADIPGKDSSGILSNPNAETTWHIIGSLLHFRQFFFNFTVSDTEFWLPSKIAIICEARQPLVSLDGATWLFNLFISFDLGFLRSNEGWIIFEVGYFMLPEYVISLREEEVYFDLHSSLGCWTSRFYDCATISRIPLASTPDKDYVSFPGKTCINLSLVYDLMLRHFRLDCYSNLPPHMKIVVGDIISIPLIQYSWQLLDWCPLS